MNALSNDKRGQAGVLTLVVAAIAAVIGTTIFSSVLVSSPYNADSLWLLIPTVIVGVVLIAGVMLFARGR